MATDTPGMTNDSRPSPGGVDRPNYVPVGHDLTSVTEKISALVLTRPTGLGWLGCFGFSNLLAGVLVVAVAYLLLMGVGIWGLQIPNCWGFDITNFVWWIGIGHAGTLISAFLLLMHQKWRTSINRIAEAMTIFAVMCAGMFPLLHLGRPWFFFWLLPYANTMSLWPQFRSALIFDVFAVSTYFTVSLLFWYMGMIPDLATLRDRATNRVAQTIYGMLALGWRNSARHWQRFEMAYLLLGGLATPLVISVHSVVSADFAVSLVPAWHETVFPPYFVAGAIFSGFAMVILLCVPIRHFYHLQEFITIDHLDVMGKLVLATSLITSYGYLSEQTFSWYAGDTVEWYTYWFRISGFGQYAYITWLLFFCNTIVPQILWIKPLRRKESVLVIVSLLVLLGMWLERYMIITTSLSRDQLPSSWGFFKPTIWDLATYAGSVGVFLTLFLLFARFAPIISISETRALLPGAHGPEVGR
jgi:molybdopterin-containing oxidoreductase family membrane subunit